MVFFGLIDGTLRLHASGPSLILPGLESCSLLNESKDDLQAAIAPDVLYDPQAVMCGLNGDRSDTVFVYRKRERRHPGPAVGTDERCQVQVLEDVNGFYKPLPLWRVVDRLIALLFSGRQTPSFGLARADGCVFWGTGQFTFRRPLRGQKCVPSSARFRLSLPGPPAPETEESLNLFARKLLVALQMLLAVRTGEFEFAHKPGSQSTSHSPRIFR